MIREKSSFKVSQNLMTNFAIFSVKVNFSRNQRLRQHSNYAQKTAQEKYIRKIAFLTWSGKNFEVQESNSIKLLTLFLLSIVTKSAHA